MTDKARNPTVFCEVAKEIASFFRIGFSGEQCGRLTDAADQLGTIGD
jgi:hypothetical protein